MARTWRKIGTTSSDKSNNVCVDGSQIVADNVTINSLQTYRPQVNGESHRGLEQ